MWHRWDLRRPSELTRWRLPDGFHLFNKKGTWTDGEEVKAERWSCPGAENSAIKTRTIEKQQKVDLLQRAKQNHYSVWAADMAALQSTMETSISQGGEEGTSESRNQNHLDLAPADEDLSIWIWLFGCLRSESWLSRSPPSENQTDQTGKHKSEHGKQTDKKKLLYERSTVVITTNPLSEPFEPKRYLW